MHKVKGILDFFSGKPRAGQASLLTELADKWNEGDVFVLSAPTAFGKTKTIEAIAKWAMSKKKTSHIMVPNNLLLEQMEKSFRVFSLKSRDSHTCYTPSQGGASTSCGTHHSATGEHCSGCPYVLSIRKAHGMPFSLSNYHTFMAHKLYKQVLLIDEAHLLLPMIKELEAKHVWLPVENGQSLLPFYLKTYSQLQEYLARHPELAGKVWDELRSELDGGRERYLIERKERTYHGRMRDCLSLIPVDTSHGSKSNIFFNPKKVEKIILLSGTISKIDVEQLGLKGKRIVFLEGDSPIDTSRRPIDLQYLSSITAREYPTIAPLLAKRVADLVGEYDGKVLVHCPYSLADAMYPHLKTVLKERLWKHGRTDKREVVDAFKTTTEPVVLLGSGLEEGLDLYGDDFRLQIICKVPFPNLGEPAWKFIAETDPERYAWESIKKIVQAAGRICRGPEDYGRTIILDKNFERVRLKYDSLLPNYFKEALIQGKGAS